MNDNFKDAVKDIVVLVDRQDLRSGGAKPGDVIKARVAGNQAIPLQAGLRTFSLVNGRRESQIARPVSSNTNLIQWRLATEAEVTAGSGAIA